MHPNIDLRYIVPPLISLRFIFLLPSDYDSLGTYHPTVKMVASLLLHAIVTFFFLSISIKLSLSVRVAANAIRLQVGDFSGPVALSLLCLIFLPRPHFWVAYLIIICISPWYASLSNLLKHFLYWFYQKIIQAIPTLNITCFTQQQEHPEQEPPPPQVEAELVEVEESPVQPRLEQDVVVVIDE